MRFAKKRQDFKPDVEPEEKAYQYCIYLLSLKLRTQGELEFKMQQKGYGQKPVRVVIEKLRQAGYINDERYAEVFLQNLKAYKYLGYFGVKNKMREKLLPPALVEELLQNGYLPEEEEKIARNFLRSRRITTIMKNGAGQEHEYVSYATDKEKRRETTESKRKISSLLQSRGFRTQVISKLLSAF